MKIKKNSLEISLRYIFVAIIIVRFSLIIFHKEEYFGYHVNKTYEVLFLINLMWIVWGRFLIIGFPFLNILMVKLDDLYGTQTLGTTVACMTSFSLLANNLLIKFNSSRFKILHKCDNFLKNRFINIIHPRVLYYYSFIAYSTSSLLALFFHLNDQTWLAGKTLSEIFTSSYLCRFHEPFILFENSHKELMFCFSAVAVIGQTLFQSLMLFSFVNRYVLIFTKTWGWLFIISCALFIQLSYLPFLEIVLWFSLFNGYSGCGKTINIRPGFIRKCKTHILITITLIISFIFYFFQIPNVGVLSNLFGVPKVGVSLNFYKSLGFEIPNVFNQDDLKMSDHWMTLHRINSYDFNHTTASQKKLVDFNKSSITLVPITKINGAKAYYQFSDLLYFSNTLQYRRYLNHRPALYSHNPGSYCSKLIERRIKFDYRYNKFKSKIIYMGTYHERDNSDKRLSTEKFKLFYEIDAEQNVRFINF